MFDEMIKELRQIEGQQVVSLFMPSDRDSYFDRECPAPACQFKFKVQEDGLRDKIHEEKMHCPFCGHTAALNEWYTQEQIEHIQNTAFVDVANRLNNALKRDIDQWNRRQSLKSPISMTMKADSRPLRLPLLPAAMEPMRFRIVCSECECRYAAIGAAFFCPACGHKEAELIFSQTITRISQSLESLANIKEKFPDRDTAETTSRMVIESGLQNVVTTFQCYVFVEQLISSSCCCLFIKHRDRAAQSSSYSTVR